MIQETSYCGWIYKYDSGDGSFRIVPKDCRLKKPSSLFKYYSLSQNTVDALLHNYLYAAHPNQLNDYFDCCPNLIIYDNPAILRKALDDAGYNHSRLSNGDLLKNEDIIRMVRNVLWQTKYSKIGIMSFSEDPWNVLMWSHYSQNRGICVEFDYSLFPFSYQGPFPINYQPKVREVHLKDTDFGVAVAVQFNVKHKRWKYEKEWRIIAQTREGQSMEVFGEPDLEKYGGRERKFLYSINAIRNVGLGFSFFDPNELHFSEDCSNACISLNPQRDDTDLRRRLLEWLCSHNITVNLAMREGLDNIHFCTSRIVKDSNNLSLQILDKIV